MRFRWPEHTSFRRMVLDVEQDYGITLLDCSGSRQRPRD
jgi:hypothetical protein